MVEEVIGSWRRACLAETMSDEKWMSKVLSGTFQ